MIARLCPAGGLVNAILAFADRLRCKPAARSIELYEMGMSRAACYRITGVDPIQARHELMALSALWGCLVGAAALAVLVTVWAGVAK